MKILEQVDTLSRTLTQGAEQEIDKEVGGLPDVIAEQGKKRSEKGKHLTAATLTAAAAAGNAAIEIQQGSSLEDVALENLGK